MEQRTQFGGDILGLHSGDWNISESLAPLYYSTRRYIPEDCNIDSEVIHSWTFAYNRTLYITYRHGELGQSEFVWVLVSRDAQIPGAW
jgi:hypothetical protein